MRVNSINELIKEINILEIEPNQSLLVKLNTVLNQQTKQDIGRSLKKSLGCNVVIIDPGVELDVVEVADEDSNN